MVNWKSIQELELEGDAASKLAHIFAGLYFWEVICSLDFEWSFIRGRKKLSWPLIPYFLCRYLALGIMIGMVIISDALGTGIDCRGLLLFVYLAGLHMLFFANANMAIRTMVIWGMKLYIVVPLCLLSVGYWVLAIQYVHVFGGTRKSTGGCFPMRSDRRILVATFIYPVVVDFIVLVLAAYKLVIQSRSYHRSRLMKLLFNDGFIYFIIVFVINIPTAVISYLELNPILYILFAIPASIVTVIASSRAVRRLSNFSPEKPAIYMITSLGEIVRTRELSRISFARPQKDGPTDTPSVVASVPGDSNPSIVNSNVAEVKNRPHVHNDANV